MKPRNVAKALAWFGIGLGALEVLAPRQVARMSGLDGGATLIRLFGFREIGTGVFILAARDPAAWLWTRVLGDALDGALLSAGMRPSNPRNGRAVAALALVSPVVALDTYYAFRRWR